MRVSSCLLLLGVLVSACVNTDLITGDGPLPTSEDAAGDLPPQFPDQAPIPDGVTPYAGEPVVFAHSATELYKVDPKTFAVTLVGAFKWPGGADQMTDIAVDRQGKMTGISFTKVYSVNSKTAACTFLANLKGGMLTGAYNGLSYISVQGVDKKEVLMASRENGDLFQLDPTTGQAKGFGVLGGGYGTSGDLVSVRDLGTLATVRSTTSSTDLLARLDPSTGKATIIGDTGFMKVWGLGYWKDKIYGFTDNKQFILIDPKTGKGTVASTGQKKWWGAGVTTKAPVVIK